jgi:hypothetical protein
VLKDTCLSSFFNRSHEIDVEFIFRLFWQDQLLPRCHIFLRLWSGNVLRLDGLDDGILIFVGNFRGGDMFRYFGDTDFVVVVAFFLDCSLVFGRLRKNVLDILDEVSIFDGGLVTEAVGCNGCCVAFIITA